MSTGTGGRTSCGRILAAVASICLGALLTSPMQSMLSSPLALAAVTGTARAPRGVLDPTFGSGGRAFGALQPALASSRFTSLVREPDGKLLLKATLLSEQEPAIERRDPDGQLDPGFGEGGTAKVGGDSLPIEGEQRGELGLQSNGAVVYAEGGGCEARTKVKRPRSDGLADSGFGSVGATELPFSFDGLAVDAQNRILVLGLTGLSLQCLPKAGPLQEVRVARLLPDGAPDPSFGTNGVLSVTAGGAPLSQALTFAVREDGSVVVLAGNQKGRLLVG